MAMSTVPVPRCPHGIRSERGQLRCELCQLAGPGGTCPHGIPRSGRCHYCTADGLKAGRLAGRQSAAQRAAVNYVRKTRGPKGGDMPLYAQQTGDVLLPQPLRYDAMGYAWGPGMGVEDETPAVQPLPWTIDQPEDPTEAAEAARWAKWEKAGTVIGVIGGALGLYFSARAFMGAGKDEGE